MNATEYQLDNRSIQKLLSAANGDAALVYLYLCNGGEPAGAEHTLGMTQGRYQCAVATLRQLELWPEEKTRFVSVGERPSYSEQDVVRAMERDIDFHCLYEEIQRLLGRNLNTEELKIILGFVRYLGMSADVICVLVNYCKQRARRRGSLRNPSLRSIEKEAYAWAEQGIDTIEQAGAFIQRQNLRYTQLHSLMELLQIHGRELTAAEERYARSWLEMGFDREAFEMAYERTCLNTGGMNWAYMNKILLRWHEAGLHNAQQIRSGDTKKGRTNAPRELDSDELAAIEQMMKEG